jgi:uncharacterized protein (TIGR02246 family)
LETILLNSEKLTKTTLLTGGKTMEQVRSMIEAMNERFMTAFNRSDAASVAACYTENARLLPPGSDIVQGRAAIESFWQAVMASGVTKAELKTIDVADVENLAREVGKFTLTVQQGNEKMLSSGKYVVIWKRENGLWKLDIDIWNS